MSKDFISYLLANLSFPTWHNWRLGELWLQGALNDVISVTESNTDLCQIPSLILQVFTKGALCGNAVQCAQDTEVNKTNYSAFMELDNMKNQQRENKAGWHMKCSKWWCLTQVAKKTSWEVNPGAGQGGSEGRGQAEAAGQQVQRPCGETMQAQ